MEQTKSLKSYIKGIPVIGPAARFANKCRFYVSDLLVRQKNAFLRMKHTAFWYGLRNPQGEKEFARHRPSVTSEQQKLIESLTVKGIAVGDSGEMGIAPEESHRLQERISEFARASAERINAATTSYSDKMDLGPLEHNRERFRRFFRDKDEAKLDDYILKMNAENSVLPSDHPLITVGLSAPVLNVVGNYLKLWPRLIYADAWYSIPMDPGKRVGSQKWHRDPEDKQMVKVYLYFSQVDESAGAMEYIPGTTNALAGRGLEIGKWKAAGANLYPSEEMVEEVFPASERVFCSGNVGTLLFCDTTGLHRGGVSRSRPRIVATWTFVTPASRHQRRFTLRPVEGWPLSPEGQIAVGQ